MAPTVCVGYLRAALMAARSLSKSLLFGPSAGCDTWQARPVQVAPENTNILIIVHSLSTQISEDFYPELLGRGHNRQHLQFLL